MSDRQLQQTLTEENTVTQNAPTITYRLSYERFIPREVMSQLWVKCHPY